MRFRKKPIVIEAIQWFKNGDHPLDKSEMISINNCDAFLTEGKIVRYFRTPSLPGDTICSHCKDIMHNHGWIDTLEGKHVVCPGDWIITGIKNEKYPCKPDIFEATYEPVEDEK